MTSTGHKRRTLVSSAFFAAALCVFAAPASAQLYPGADVSVNPAAAGGAQVLRYPGGQYERVLPPLLQPGEPYPGSAQAPIHLHMPVHHAAARRAPPVAEAEPPQETASETDVPPPVAAPRTSRPAKREAAAEPASAPSAAAGIPFSFGGDSGTAPPPPKVSSERQGGDRHPQAKAAPEKTASAAPAQAVSSARGLAKQAAILFDQNSSELSGESGAQLKDLSSSLNAALASGADRVELVGYGGTPGDKSSDARRISLKRALAIRETLIADGLPANRIDVRALGGADDDGPANRVDIFVKG